MKTIIVLVHGEFLRQINYRTKSECRRNFAGFKKYGILDLLTGETIIGATFEMICF